MTPPRLAIATAPFRQTLRESIVTAQTCGAAGVQFDARYELKPAEFGVTARRQLLHELRERDLSVASLDFPLRSTIYDADRIDDRMAALRRTMEFASQLKSSVVTVRSGPLPEDENSAEAVRLADVLEDLARYGNHIGATLCLTSAGADAEQLAAVVREAVRQGPLAVDFDPAAALLARRQPGADLRTLHDCLGQFQLRDAVRDTQTSGRETALGRGEIDWDEMFALIGEMHFRGWLVVRRNEGDDRVGDAARAVKYAKAVMLE
ncbi:MAG: sugar phosphate isomerase/epimerase [Planctomycetota bacterium]|nr:MAG: sugar phosphate isomerase/epimerase [Planctomycetota bacterium]